METKKTEGGAAEGFAVERLAPCRVAAARGFGEGPEEIAWQTMLSWMDRRGLPIGAARFFGFNNPNPTPATRNYGYEQWVVLEGEAGKDAERATGPDEGVEFKDFAGGLYAVAEHRGPPEALGGSWGRLGIAVEKSRYRRTAGQWLEQFRTPELPEGQAGGDLDRYVFGLYLAVDEE